MTAIMWKEVKRVKDEGGVRGKASDKFSEAQKEVKGT